MIWCFFHENWTLFASDCCLRNRNNNNSKTHLLIFLLSVIEDIYVLLLTGISFPFTLFFPTYLSFSVIHSRYFSTHIILNCHRQWLVYKQKNINIHGYAKRNFYIDTRRNFQSFSFISKWSYLSSLLISYDRTFKYIMKILLTNFLYSFNLVFTS